MRVEKEYALFGKVLKKYRIASGMSQNALANLAKESGLKLNRVSITNIEAGKQRIMLRDALILSQTLDFSLDEVKSLIVEKSLKARISMQPKRVKKLLENLLIDRGEKNES